MTVIMTMMMILLTAATTITSAYAFGGLSPLCTNRNHNNNYFSNSCLSSSSSSLSSSSRPYAGNNNNNDEVYEHNNTIKTKTNAAFTQNEFPRIIYIDRIFNNRRRTYNQQQRDHVVTIKADEKERLALAERFDLKGLTKLDAEISLRPAAEGLTAFAGLGSFPVEVEGMIKAHLTQTCVRTNEEFEVDVEIPVYVIVRPVESNFEGQKLIDAQQQQPQETETEKNEEEEGNYNKGKKKKKTKKDKGLHKNKKVYKLSDVFDLQTAIQQADTFGSGTGAADIVEDEGIYSLSSDQLDVGELVAQTFWLELDWYPKKPGTGPVEYEMST
mmetsp:Transcript_59874/g.66929  ORF Transcript_59874/g.66929 Transcript_59874/m.66929 type:complete len:328 (+) Transcript_59874:143-1126(+)